MLNDPELLMLFATQKQEELRRTMQRARWSPFRKKLSVLNGQAAMSATTEGQVSWIQAPIDGE